MEMSRVFENFTGLTEEKKKKILDACMEEFARNGYQGASTNNIVKSAGISKGLLFHYFGNKKQLYLFLIDRAVEYSLSKYKLLRGSLSSDLFERIARIGRFRLELGDEEPLLHTLLYNSFVRVPGELKAELAIRYERLYREEVPAVFEGLDLSRFRSDVDPKMAVEVILIFLEGLQKKYTGMYSDKPSDSIYKDRQQIFKEMTEYLEVIKKGVYKEA